MSEPDVVLTRVLRTVADVLQVPPSRLSLETEASEIDAWDSFGHVRIVLAVEAEFRITLSMAEIGRSASIHGLVEVVEAALRRVRC